jgi:SAM-dependent methyltransferase
MVKRSCATLEQRLNLVECSKSSMGLYEFGGTEDQVRRIQKRFLRYFADCKVVLDLGCGRGIFLELLREKGKQGLGVDDAKEAIDACRTKGFTQVYQDDAIRFLTGKRAKYDGIFCSHLIEHLQYEEALRLLELCSEALKPAGTLVLVTPNPSDLQVLSEIFWLDPTHKRFYPLPLVKIMLQHFGFAVVQQGKFLGSWRTIRRRHLPGYLFRRLLWGEYFGKPNAFIVAKKKAERPGLTL